MKRLARLGMIALVLLVAGPAGAQPMTVQAPPGGLDVNVIDTRTPVQLQEVTLPCTAGSCRVDVFQVPEGKRLVVEYLSLRTSFAGPAPGQSVQVRLNTEFHDQFQPISVGTTTDNGTGINAEEVFAGPVKAYAQSGASVSCDALAPNFEGFVDATCTITGFLEDEN